MANANTPSLKKFFESYFQLEQTLGAYISGEQTFFVGQAPVKIKPLEILDYKILGRNIEIYFPKETYSLKELKSFYSKLCKGEKDTNNEASDMLNKISKSAKVIPAEESSYYNDSLFVKAENEFEFEPHWSAEKGIVIQPSFEKFEYKGHASYNSGEPKPLGFSSEKVEIKYFISHVTLGMVPHHKICREAFIEAAEILDSFLEKYDLISLF